MRECKPERWGGKKREREREKNKEARRKCLFNPQVRDLLDPMVACSIHLKFSSARLESRLINGFGFVRA